MKGGVFVDLTSRLTALKGVGEKREKLYQKLGINCIGDLLEHYPRGYLDLTGSLAIKDASDEHPCAVRATVTQKGATQPVRRGLTVTKVRATDMERDLLITFFNAKYTVDALEIGREYIFYGDFTRRLTGGEMNSPVVISAEESGFLPQYPLTEGLSSKMVSAQMKAALESCQSRIKETLSTEIMQKYGLCSKAEALCGIHFPVDQAELEKAKKRLVFEEFLAFSLGMSLTKGRVREESGNAFANLSTEEFTRSLGFELTGAQKRVIEECKKDMCSAVPMSRLIQGDVGSGKTAVAAACMYFAAKNGFQSAMMAPTEVLAAQHKTTLEKMFAPFGIKVGLLTGSMKASEKAAVKSQIESGKIAIVTGTHALIQEDVAFKSLGLIITDEQHRFGVRQRMALGKKGNAPHTIVMSATPIPRTLAFVLYGDLDVSVLDEMPKNRIPVKTYLVGPELSQRALGFVRNFAKEGKQSYIVCPLIERTEDSLPLEAAADLAEQIAGQELVDCNVGLLHGRMKPAEKERVMNAFAENRLQVLVSTTVIEVGVDVPNAVCMVIENADRFGISQLHQLRGRVGRGTEQSYCILISGTKSAETKRRLEVIAKTTDGFKVAEEDLKLRGPGDFFGYRQSGLPMLKMADMMTDIKLLELAKKACSEILEEDPKLSKPENAALSRNIQKLLEETAM
ncbi:MAG: ATP-dependent DNA helicase RecG [Oscillospiraceae bacterium]|nr:ATP-dependent DNA helicase RecG [Oscillospiraceae bacterium]